MDAAYSHICAFAYGVSSARNALFPCFQLVRLFMHLFLQSVSEESAYYVPDAALSTGNTKGNIKNSLLGFPGGAVVESLPASAGNTGSSPGLGGSHMPWSGWAREPQLLSLRVWSLCSATREAAIVRGPRTAMRSGPHLPRLVKALAQKRRPNTAINK